MIVMTGLTVAVIVSLVTVVMTDGVEETVVGDIHQSLMVISLIMVMGLQMMNMSAVVKVFMDMKCRRRVSFSNTVEKKEIPRVSMFYDEQARKDDEHPATVDITQLDSSKAYVKLDLEDRGGSTESRNGLMFTFDSEKFD